MWKKIILLALSLLPVTLWAAGSITQARQSELYSMLYQDCGSCHGLTMRGGLGPALLPSTLHGKPKQLLVSTILYGRHGTAMPPWNPMLNADEAGWIIDLLLEQPETGR